MKYISIDVETTGLEPENAMLLEFGAMLEDTNNPRPRHETPTFERRILHSGQPIVGSPYAIAKFPRNVETLGLQADYDLIRDPAEATLFAEQHSLCQHFELAAQFKQWLFDVGYVTDADEKGKIYLTVAGKNFPSFDYKFLQANVNFAKIFKIRHRTLDPGVLFIDWNEDNVPPGLSECKHRAGLFELVTHRAIDDAWDVIQLLRTQYAPDLVNKNIIKDFDGEF